jgi:hypothetical protein
MLIIKFISKIKCKLENRKEKIAQNAQEEKEELQYHALENMKGCVLQ